jgi:hypothetical protein
LHLSDFRRNPKLNLSKSNIPDQVPVRAVS